MHSLWHCVIIIILAAFTYSTWCMYTNLSLLQLIVFIHNIMGWRTQNVSMLSLGEKEVEWRLIKKFTLPVPSCYYFLVKLKQECDKNDWLKHCYGLTDLTTKENENKTSIKTGFCYDVQDFIYLELWGRQKWIEKVS